MNQSNQSSERDTRSMHLYLSFMEEAKYRLESIHTAYRNEAHFPVQIMRELCYLQFRFTCEIIALCCLVAHGNTSKRLMNTYEASKIINEMQRLNPDFYPQPVEFASDGPKKWRITRRDGSVHLTRNDLIKLWGITGDVTHRSPLSKAIRPRNRDPADFADIFEWGTKITGLLSNHLIVLASSRALLVSISVEGTGKPNATILDFASEPGTVHAQIFRAK